MSGEDKQYRLYAFVIAIGCIIMFMAAVYSYTSWREESYEIEIVESEPYENGDVPSM